MDAEQTLIRYYFSGDPHLPFPLADLDGSISEFGLNREKRLAEWLGDKVTVQGTIESNVTIEGPVFIGPGTTIHSGVDIRGPVYIGPHCSVRHGSQLRPGTILSEGCVVGHTAEIKNSVCMSGSKMQSGVFVGDSVVGLEARIGSGVITANRRFDQGEIFIGSRPDRVPANVDFFGVILGDYSRLGANVVTEPGAAVGPYTWIGPLVKVSGFIPRAQLVTLKQELTIRDKPEVTLRSGRGEYERH